MTMSTITSKGQTTIPKNVRDAAGLRPGDNLYSDCVVALDATTGKLKWHFQFTPHDEWDWDAVQTPVLLWPLNATGSTMFCVTILFTILC